jgi:hypothetical protein
MHGTARARRAGPPRPEPGAGSAGPGAAQRRRLIQYGSTRQRGAIQAFLCCVLAALGSAAADCLYVSSVFPLKSSNRRRQIETHIRTALIGGVRMTWLTSGSRHIPPRSSWLPVWAGISPVPPWRRRGCPGRPGCRVIRAQHPLAVGQGPLEQRDRLAARPASR